MTIQESKDRVDAIKRESRASMDRLFADVLASRLYTDGQLMVRTRLNSNGSVYDYIEAEIIGARVSLYQDGDFSHPYPRIIYWTRVLTPTYYSHQHCPFYGIELGKAEDFWQGDERWKPIPAVNQ